VLRTRQIYLRSDGEVQFITLTPWHQIAGLVLGLAGLFWVAYATINVAFKDQLLVIKERRLYEARLEYEDRIAELRRSIDRINDRLLLDQASYLDKVDEVRADYEKLVERHRMLTEFFRQGWMPTKPSQAAKELDVPDVAKDAQAPSKSSKGSLNELTIRQKYAAEFRSATEVVAPIEDVRSRFGGLEDLQVTLLDEVIAETDRRAEAARQMFAKLGIDARLVVAGSRYVPANVGGPFVAATAEDFGSERIAERVDKMVERLTAVEKLRYEGGKLPLYLPLKEVKRVSSTFGLRRDPLRRVAAMHTGVDFNAARRSPVLATAAGRVVKAGWDGAYGRMVEIDHGFGVTTRFAHLDAIRVKLGQIVARGQLVGLLGNTGRSTGYHLHYETRVNGRAIDPVRFWKVRHDLQAIAN
jgi:murein DD-endopeptidase MepM/ murein hydrolase activator NlpD